MHFPLKSKKNSSWQILNFQLHSTYSNNTKVTHEITEAQVKMQTKIRRQYVQSTYSSA